MALTQNDVRQITQIIHEEVRAALGLFLGETRIEKVDEGSDPVADVVQLDPEVSEPVSRYEGWGDVATPETDGATLLFHNGFQGVELPRSMPRYRPSGDFTKRGGRALYSSESGTLVALHGRGSATPGVIEIRGRNASVVIDKDGHITIIPAAGAKVKLGSGTDAELDPVVLRSELKTQIGAIVGVINSHKHTGVTVGMGVTGTTDTSASNVSDSIGSSNVVAKK